MTAGSNATAGPASSPVVQPASTLTAASTAAPNRVVTYFNITSSFSSGRRVSDVQRLSLLAKRGGLLAHPSRDRIVGRDPLRLGVVTHVLGDLHGAEVRAAHRA